MNADLDRSGDNRQPDRHPLIDAAMFLDADSVEAFLAAGANPRVADENGFSTLHAAAWMGDGDGVEENEPMRRIIESLVRAGADPNARDAHGRTSLHHAVEGDGPSLTAVHALLRSGAEPNAPDEDGSTPLHGAVRQAARACVDALLAAGADWSFHNSDGESAADLARVSVKEWEENVRHGPMDVSCYGVSDEAMRAEFARHLADARAIFRRAVSESGFHRES